MQNQLIVETKADDPWVDRNQRPMNGNTLHAQSRAEMPGSRPLFSA